MNMTLLGIAVALVSASSPSRWLDATIPVTWNIAGGVLPAAPIVNHDDLKPGGRCASELRPASSPEDRLTVRRGWYLVGPYQRYGRTSIVMATSSNDGMCRPSGYQGFVFFRGAFAGTLSPKLMDSRADASISALGVNLSSESMLSAVFVRYSQSDPLCCPHGKTNVSYRIRRHEGYPVLEPVSAETTSTMP